MVEMRNAGAKVWNTALEKAHALGQRFSVIATLHHHLERQKY